MANEESSLSNWAGPYVTEMLGRGQALADQPYTAYEGPLTAGQSSLQNTAFTGLGGLSAPTSMGAYTPQSFTGAGYAAPTSAQAIDSTPTGMAQAVAAIPTANTYSQNDINTVANAINSGAMTIAQVAEQFGVDEQYVIDNMSQINNGAGSAGLGKYTPASGNTVQQYMTPYLQGALQPQYDAATRQSQIAQQAMQSQYGKAGAYGGGRQAVAGAELDRGLLDRMAGITGTGYQNAFEQAQSQFNTEQGRSMAAQQDANRYGFDVLGAQQTGGGLQRAIEAEGIAADRAQFQQERDYDKSNVLFTQSLLDGMPLETQTYNYTQPSGIQNLGGALSDSLSILDQLSGNSTAPIPANRMNEFNVFVSANMANGMDQAAAAAAARTTMGL